jgi:hypothetical protein
MIAAEREDSGTDPWRSGWVHAGDAFAGPSRPGSRGIRFRGSHGAPAFVPPSEASMALRLAALLVSLLLARLAAAGDPLPIEVSRVLDVGSASTVFSVDLGTLPTRPVLIVEAIPDAAHPDMWIEIEVTDYDLPPGGDGWACPNPSESNRVLGRRLERV